MSSEGRLALGFAISTALACLPAEEECFRASRDVEAEETVRGYVVGDLLEPYFGRYDGTLSWQNGGTTAFSLELEQDPDSPYALYEIYDCAPRLVSHSGSATIFTSDGAFDDSIGAVVTAPFPYSSLVPDSAVKISQFPEEEWNERMREHLAFDASRYFDGGLQLMLDWPPGEAGPTGGSLDFLGVIDSTPPLFDTIRVASLAF